MSDKKHNHKKPRPRKNSSPLSLLAHPASILHRSHRPYAIPTQYCDLRIRPRRRSGQKISLIHPPPQPPSCPPRHTISGSCAVMRSVFPMNLRVAVKPSRLDGMYGRCVGRPWSDHRGLLSVGDDIREKLLEELCKIIRRDGTCLFAY